MAKEDIAPVVEEAEGVDVAAAVHEQPENFVPAEAKGDPFGFLLKRIETLEFRINKHGIQG